jgi:hypothetical protein
MYLIIRHALDPELEHDRPDVHSTNGS